jgi:hypothetical protein
VFRCGELPDRPGDHRGWGPDAALRSPGNVIRFPPENPWMISLQSPGYRRVKQLFVSYGVVNRGSVLVYDDLGVIVLSSSPCD